MLGHGAVGPTRRRAFVAVVSWTLFSVGAWTAHGIMAGPANAQAEQRGVDEESPLTDGELLWKRDCASCHGIDGNGTAWAPSLQGKGPAGVHLTVTTGRMPMELLAPLGDRRYDPDDIEIVANVRGGTEYLPGQVAALVEYSREILTGPDVPIVDIATADISHGQELFATNCAACHVWNGRGGALSNGHVATSTLHASPENVVEAMRTGLGTMPEFPQAVISDEEANDIAAYVQYLKRPANPGGHPLAYVGPAAEGFVAWFVGLLGILLLARWIGQRSS